VLLVTLPLPSRTRQDTGLGTARVAHSNSVVASFHVVHSGMIKLALSFVVASGTGAD
jgi:hypothetical protein